MPDKVPFITVAMPVRNEEKFISSILEELGSQDYPSDRFEVIVADGESTDRTREVVREIAKDHPQVILMNNPGRLSSSGRNVGFKHGKGDYFVVIDGHCTIGHDQLFNNLVDCFQRSGAQCLARPQPFILPEAPNWQRAIGLARSSWLGHSTKSDIYSNKEGFVSPVSAGCAYKREVFEKIGYVDETFDACEDVEFNYRVERAGFKTFFSPKIAVGYYPRESIRSLWRQLGRYAAGRIHLAKKHPETLNLEMLLPTVFVVGLVIAVPLSLMHIAFAWCFFSVLSLYLCIVLWESFRISYKTSRMNLVSPIGFVFVCIHIFLGIGSLMAMFKHFSSDQVLQKAFHQN